MYSKEIRYDAMSLTRNYKIPLILLIAIYNNNELYACGAEAENIQKLTYLECYWIFPLKIICSQ